MRPLGHGIQRSWYWIGDHGSSASSATAFPLVSIARTMGLSSALSVSVWGVAVVPGLASFRNDAKDASSVTGGAGRDGAWVPPVHLCQTRSCTLSRCRVVHSHLSCQLT